MTDPDGPLRQRIADDLRGAITDGRLKPGDQVPSERDLAGRYKVSRDTARAAVDRLRAEGLVVAAGWRGTVVRTYDPLVTLLTSMERGRRRDNPTLALDDWMARVREQGREPRQVVTVDRDAAASASIVERLPERLGLHVEPGDHVVRRHRMRWVDDRPTQVVDSWFPWEVASATMVSDPTRRPLLEDGDVVLPSGLLRATGQPQVRLAGDITGTIATPEEARELALPPSTVALVSYVVGYDAGGEPLRLMVTTAPADRNVFRYEIDL